MTFQANPLVTNWDTLVDLMSSAIFKNRDDGAMHAKYTRLMADLRHDQFHDDDKVVALGLMRAPASAQRHHAFEGGLVAHLLEMWEIWADHVKPFVFRFKLRDELISDSIVLRSIVHHDLDKVYKYQFVSKEPWKVDYAKKWDRVGQLLTGPHKSLYFLNRHDIHVPLHLHNALITSHGGYTKDYPYAESVLAKIVYLLDEMSANIGNRMENNLFWDSLIGGVDG